MLFTFNKTIKSVYEDVSDVLFSKCPLFYLSWMMMKTNIALKAYQYKQTITASISQVWEEVWCSSLFLIVKNKSPKKLEMTRETNNASQQANNKSDSCCTGVLARFVTESQLVCEKPANKSKLAARLFLHVLSVLSVSDGLCSIFSWNFQWFMTVF